MPTTDIIGYLWGNRQALDLEDLADVLAMASDLQRGGLEVVRAQDITVLGTPVGTSVQLIRNEQLDWDILVHDAVLQASVEHTAHMFHEESDEA